MPKRKIRTRRPRPSSSILTGVAWYTPEGWRRLRETAPDRDKLHDAYEDWEVAAENMMRMMGEKGITTVRVDVDIDELLAWCQANGKPMDGAARSKFVTELLEKSNTKST